VKNLGKVLVICALAIASSNLLSLSALAGPPSYLLLRTPEDPGPHHHPGYPAAVTYDVRSYPYAYGWFGVAPRSHASRHFGYYRIYTQWSRW
jgi:hypothetical protein